MSIAKKAITGILYSGMSSYILFTVNLAGQLVLVRILLPEDFGNFALVNSIFGILAIATSWSFPTAIIQMEPEEGLNDTAFWLSLAQGLIIIILAYITFMALSIYYPENRILPPIFIVLGISRASTVIASLYSAHLEKELNYRSISAVRIVASFSSIAGALGMASKGFGIWSLVGRELLSTFFIFLGYRHISPWRFQGKFNRNSAKKLLSFSNKTLLSKGLESVACRLDFFFVGLLGGITTLGYYSQARYIVDMVNAAVTPISVVAFPVYAKLKDKAQHLHKAYQLHSNFLLWVTVPACLIFIISPGEFIILLLGEKWRPSAEVLPWLAPYVILMPLFVALRALLYGLGKIGIDIGIQSVQISAAIVSILIGIFIFGPAGAANGLIFSITIGIVASYMFLYKYIWEGTIDNLVPPIFAGIITTSFIILLKVNLSLPESKWIELSWMLATVCSYLTVLFLINKRNLMQNFQSIKDKVLSELSDTK